MALTHRAIYQMGSQSCQANRDNDINRICERWETKKTDFVRDGRSYAAATRLSSLETSIKLSMESPIMNDAARLLLSILAVFPDGLDTNYLSSLPHLPSPAGPVAPTEIVDLLLDTSLTSIQPLGYPKGASAYRLLVPIQEYIDKRSRPIPDNVFNILFPWVQMASESMNKLLIKCALRRDPNPTPARLHRLADAAFCIFLSSIELGRYGISHSSGGSRQNEVFRLLSAASSGRHHDERTQAVLAMWSAVSGSLGHSQDWMADEFNTAFQTIKRIGDVHKQAQSLLLRGS